MRTLFDNNFLLMEGRGHTGDCWPEVVPVKIKCQYSPVWLKQSRLVSSLLYGNQTKLVYF